MRNSVIPNLLLADKDASESDPVLSTAVSMFQIWMAEIMGANLIRCTIYVSFLDFFLPLKGSDVHFIL